MWRASRSGHFAAGKVHSPEAGWAGMNVLEKRKISWPFGDFFFETSNRFIENIIIQATMLYTHHSQKPCRD